MNSGLLNQKKTQWKGKGSICGRTVPDHAGRAKAAEPKPAHTSASHTPTGVAGRYDWHKAQQQLQQQAGLDVAWKRVGEDTVNWPIRKGASVGGSGRENAGACMSGRWLGLYFPCGPERGTFPGGWLPEAHRVRSLASFVIYQHYLSTKIDRKAGSNILVGRKKTNFVAEKSFPSEAPRLLDETSTGEKCDIQYVDNHQPVVRLIQSGPDFPCNPKAKIKMPFQMLETIFTLAMFLPLAYVSPWRNTPYLLNFGFQTFNQNCPKVGRL